MLSLRAKAASFLLHITCMMCTSVHYCCSLMILIGDWVHAICPLHESNNIFFKQFNLVLLQIQTHWIAYYQIFRILILEWKCNNRKICFQTVMLILRTYQVLNLNEWKKNYRRTVNAVSIGHFFLFLRQATKYNIQERESEWLLFFCNIVHDWWHELKVS